MSELKRVEDVSGGVGILTVENLEPHEKAQAAMLGEFREVARKEERRMLAEMFEAKAAELAEPKEQQL